MIKPYYDHAGITIYHGDCLEIMPQLEPVDLVITSPPYNIKTGKGGAWNVEDWYEDDKPELEYQAEQIYALNLMAKLTNCVCYNHKIRQRENLAIHPLEWILKTNLKLFQEIIWNRKSTHNHCGNYFWPIDERIYILVRNPIVVERRDYTTIWTFNFEQSAYHCAPFPKTLPMRLLKAISCDSVLDPFMGSGTTLVAAKQLNRKAIGIEIEEKYVEIAIKRLQQEVIPFTEQKNRMQNIGSDTDKQESLIK